MIGNYFKTGKTIVIDDQFDEAKPLLKSLYKHQIPHYYSDGRPASDTYPLPAEQLHFRLIFLDLNLQLHSSMGGSDSDEFKNFKAQHLGIIDRIIKNENHSYLLVIWSQEEEKYREHFEEIFDPEERYHTTKKPYKILSLSKSDFFSEGEFVQGKEEELFSKIQQELQGLDTYKLFCEWERIVNESAGETFDTIFQLVNELDDGDKEEYLRKLITLLSVAYSGDEGYLNLTNDQMKTDSVLLALNQLLNDDIDRLILDQRQEEYNNWAEISSRKEIRELRTQVDRGIINTKLFTYTPNRPELTGSIYEIDSGTTSVKEIFNDCIKDSKGQINTQIKDKYKSEHQGQGPSPEKLSELYPLYIEDLYSKIIAVELNVTPICDVSQGNDKTHKVLPGFIISEDVKKVINPLGAMIKTEIFKISDLIDDERIKGNAYIILDKRYLTTYPKGEISIRVRERGELPKYLFTLRNNLMHDIQVSLGNYMSRLGVLLLQER